MKGDLYFKVNGKNHTTLYEPELFVFSGGEVSVKLPERSYPHYAETITIYARLMDSDMVMCLVNLVDALRTRFGDCTMNLFMGYIPYARQDRVCNKGESLAIKNFTNIINSLNFSKVYVADPHSDVAPALIDNVRIKPVEQILAANFELSIRLRQESNLVLVSPDYGATKKVQKVSKYFGGIPVVQGTKERDLATGALTGFDLYGDVNGKHCFIVDDIGDGMGTFLGLAKILKERGATGISIYVSHGIFSKGMKILDGIFDTVYTTNSFKRVEGFDEGFTGNLEVFSWV